MSRAWSRPVAAVLGTGLTLALTACGGQSSTPAAGGHHHRRAHASSPTTPTASRTKHWPTGPPMYLDSIAPLSGTTVGVAMPISMVFTNPVKPSARKEIEQHISLTTSRPVVGAWHWFGDRRADFRPRHFWKPGTTVSMVADFDHVGDGFGRYGTHSYTRSFRIGADIHTHVYVREHKTVVTRNGTVLRSMPSDAGSAQWPSWDGTMAVVNKSRTVRMTSCSVHITCDKHNPNFYDLVLPWDVRITWSGTFLHYSTGDPVPGHSIGSHGCVHLSLANAKWFYHLSQQGDPVTITGSPRGLAAGDNGYADFDLTWQQWLAGSGRRAFTTST